MRYSRKRGFVPTGNMWAEGSVNRQRQDWLFETTFREYCEFVNVNHCFPTIAHDGQTRRLTSLASWKHAVKSNSPQKHRQRLLDFEHEQAKRINERYKKMIKDFGRTQKSDAAIKPVCDDHFFILRHNNEQHVVRKRIEMLEEAVAKAGYQDYVIKSSKTTFDDSSCYARCMLREYSSPHISSFTYTLVELCDEPLPYEKSLAYWQKRREDYYYWISSPLYQYFYSDSLASESPVKRYVVHSDI